MANLLDVGAGILAYCFHEGEIYVLLHRTTSGKKLGYLVDCGGGSKGGEPPEETAIREFGEETGGIFFPPKGKSQESLAEELSKLTTVTFCLFLPDLAAKTFFF